MSEPKHPAKFTPVLLEEIARFIEPSWKVLDPFAGTGRIHSLEADTYGVEIEPEWAAMSEGTIVGDALALPFEDEFFDAIATSPCYGNRMSDHHNARDGSRRLTYRHLLGRELHNNNSGRLQWGPKYRKFHVAAWAEALRVLKHGGRFILNVSDHIRAGKRQHVATWHLGVLEGMGLEAVRVIEVVTPRMRHGENHKARVGTETIAVFDKP